MSAGKVPVVVAGAGPVGLTVALALARRGVRTVVLERKAAPDPRSRATLIVPRALSLFAGLGVLPALLREGQRNDALRILRAADRRPLLTFDFAPLADRIDTPFALALSQDRTESILLDALHATGRATVRFGDGLARFTQQDDGVRVETSDGQALATRYLVGADGAHSAVRAQLGWSLDGTTYPTRAVLADVRVAPEADTEAGWLADPQAASFTIAIRFADGVWRIIEAAVPDDVDDADLPARAQGLAERLFGRGTWRETLWTSAYRKHERRSARYVDGRIALAGDAAHLNSPAGGQGMNTGIVDAVALADAIADGLAAPDRAVAQLCAYERDRIDAFDHQVRGLTDALERMESAPPLLRRIGFAGLGLARRAGLERVVAERLAMLAPQGGTGLR